MVKPKPATPRASLTNVMVFTTSTVGLQTETGELGVAAVQLYRLLFPDNNCYDHAGRNIKSTMGAGYQFHKWVTPLCHPPVKVMLLPDAEYFIKLLAIKGHSTAQAILLGNVVYNNKAQRKESRSIKSEPPKLTTHKNLKYIYVMTDEPRGVCKIGISKNPLNRLKDIQTGYPFKLSLYFTKAVPDAEGMEFNLHTLLDDYRLEGEWFDIGCLNLIDWPSI